MTIPGWVPDAVFYQIFPERFRNGDLGNDPPGTEPWGGAPTRENFFGGDLEGVIQGLDYIREMGFNALYLNPIFKAATNHKYDTHDYFQIDPAFGDDATFDRLIREAHARGVRVVLDGVFNHCGEGFGPFQDVKDRGPESAYLGWFDVYSFPLQTEPHPNYATCGGAYYLPRLNARNPEVEAFVHEVALYWLGRGIDGWRLDVPYEIHPDFWRRFRKAIKEKFPDAYLVAEEWRDPSAFLRGDTFDGATHYGLRNLAFDFLLTNALTGDAFARGLETLYKQMPAESEFGMLTLLGSHDTARLLTLCHEDTDAASLLYTLLFTLPGAPLVYYGDENGMTGENDPDCRKPMVWEEERWNGPLRMHLRKLIELRHRHDCLRHGRLGTVWSNDRAVAYTRGRGEEQVLVVLNNTRVPRQLTVPSPFPEGTSLRDELCEQVLEVRSGMINLDAAPRRAWVLSWQSR